MESRNNVSSSHEVLGSQDSDTLVNFTQCNILTVSNFEDEALKNRNTSPDEENMKIVDDIKCSENFDEMVSSERAKEFDEADVNSEADNFDLCNFTVLDECSETIESLNVESRENGTSLLSVENSECDQVDEKNLVRQCTEDIVASPITESVDELLIDSTKYSYPNDLSLSKSNDDLHLEIVADQLGECSFHCDNENTSNNSQVEEVFIQVDSYQESDTELSKETHSSLCDDFNIEAGAVHQDESESAEKVLPGDNEVGNNKVEFNDGTSENRDLLSFSIVDSDDKLSDENFDENQAIMLEEINKNASGHLEDTEVTDMDDFIVVDSVDTENNAPHFTATEGSQDHDKSCTVEYGGKHIPPSEDNNSKHQEKLEFIEIPGEEIDKGNFRRIVIIGKTSLKSLSLNWPSESLIKPFFILSNNMLIAEMSKNIINHEYLTRGRKILVLFVLDVEEVLSIRRYKSPNCSSVHLPLSLPYSLTYKSYVGLSSLINSMQKLKHNIEKRNRVSLIFSYLPACIFPQNNHLPFELLKQDYGDCQCSLECYEPVLYLSSNYKEFQMNFNCIIRMKKLNASEKIGHLEYVPSRISFSNEELKLDGGKCVIRKDPAHCLNDKLIEFNLSKGGKEENVLTDEALCRHITQSYSDFKVILIGDSWLKGVYKCWPTNVDCKPLICYKSKIQFSDMSRIISSFVNKNERTLIIVTVPYREFLEYKTVKLCINHDPAVIPHPHSTMFNNPTEFTEKLKTSISKFRKEVASISRNIKLIFTTCYPMFASVYLKYLLEVHFRTHNHIFDNLIISPFQDDLVSMNLNNYLHNINSYLIAVNNSEGFLHTCDIFQVLSCLPIRWFVYPLYIPNISPPIKTACILANFFNKYINGLMNEYKIGKLFWGTSNFNEKGAKDKEKLFPSCHKKGKDKSAIEKERASSSYSASVCNRKSSPIGEHREDRKSASSSKFIEKEEKNKFKMHKLSCDDSATDEASEESQNISSLLSSLRPSISEAHLSEEEENSRWNKFLHTRPHSPCHKRIDEGSLKSSTDTIEKSSSDSLIHGKEKTESPKDAERSLKKARKESPEKEESLKNKSTRSSKSHSAVTAKDTSHLSRSSSRTRSRRDTSRGRRSKSPYTKSGRDTTHRSRSKSLSSRRRRYATHRSRSKSLDIRSRRGRSRSNSRGRFYMGFYRSRSRSGNRRSSYRSSSSRYSRSRSPYSSRTKRSRKYRSRSRSYSPNRRSHSGRLSERSPSKSRESGRVHSKEVSKDSALSSLWDIHWRECEMYRITPSAHPDYSKCRRMWYEVMASQGYNVYDPNLELKWGSYWMKKMESLFKSNWDEKRSQCLKQLDLKSLKRKRDSKSPYFNDSDRARNRPNRDRKRKSRGRSSSTSDYTDNNEGEKLGVDQSKYETESQMPSSIDDLEKRIQSYLNKTNAADDSAGSSVRRSENKLLGVTTILCQISDKLGTLGYSSIVLHRKVSDAVEAGSDPMLCIDKDAKMLLAIIKDRLEVIAVDKSLSVIQKAVIEEASHGLTSILASLEDQEEKMDSKKSVRNLDINTIAKVTCGKQVKDIIMFIKNALAYQKMDNVPNEELMRIYLEVKNVQMKMVSKGGADVLGVSNSESKATKLSYFDKPLKEQSHLPAKNLDSTLKTSNEAIVDKKSLLKEKFISLPMHLKINKFAEFYSLPFEEKSVMLSYLDDLEKTDHQFALSLRCMIMKK